MSLRSQAESEQDREQFFRELREAFEDICARAATLLDGLEEFASSVDGRGKPFELSPPVRLFREQAPLFLADADRIKALTGEEFVRESGTAWEAFTTLSEMQAIKAEIYTAWEAAPLHRRLRLRIVQHLKQ